jgi:hypothetical protein
VSDRAADRASVAHLRVADLRGGVRDNCALFTHESVTLEVVVARERADGDPIALLAHVGEVREPADVDEQLRPREAEFHEREERVAAGNQLRVVARAEELDRAFDGVGDLVVERGRDHRAPPSLIARQTRSGLAGISTSVTP